jgi:hypothetical protein
VSTAAIERYGLRSAPTIAPAVAIAGFATLLFVRLLPNVGGKPLHEDEAVAGLISARPLGDVVHTVVLDRGGAPLHFLLAHVALAVDTSPSALRWLSVVFALATIPVCYDLARRLAGHSAGITAAALAATSQMLTIYGTFGRMYSLFAFTSALVADAFVRALERRTRRATLAAAVAALLPLAVHPFGAFLIGPEVLVGAAVWRGRAFRRALPVLAVSLLAIPLLLADLRLTDRYSPEAGRDLDSGTSAANAALRALGGAAGGYGAVLALFVVLAVVGAFILGRDRPAAAAYAGLTVAVPPVVLTIAAAIGVTSDRLGPRHFIFVLPLWIGLVAVAASRVPTKVFPVALACVVGAAVLTPAAVSDPRNIPSGGKEAVAAPAAWLRSHLQRGDALYPYSPVFLAALPNAAQAHALPREPVALERAARRMRDVPAVFISLPVHASSSWLVLEAQGPFPDGRKMVASIARTLDRASPAVHDTTAQAYLQQLRGTACAALTRLDSSC